MDHLPLIELVTRTYPDGVEFVEGVRVDSGPVLEVPLSSRVAVESAAGDGPPTVVVELLAARVRFVDRQSLPADPPSWDRTRQLLLAAARVLQGGQVPDDLQTETGSDRVSALGRRLEEHALATEPAPAVGDHGVALSHRDCPDCLEVARALCLAERPVDVDDVLTGAGLRPAPDEPGTEDDTSS